MICSKCNKEIAEDSVYCKYCASPVNEEEELVTKEDEIVENKVVEQEVGKEAEEIEKDEDIKEDTLDLEENESIVDDIDRVEEKSEGEKEAEESIANEATVEDNNNTKSKRKHSIITIVILAVLAVLIVVGIIIGLILRKSPEDIYKGVIKSTIDSLLNTNASLTQNTNIITSMEFATDIADLKNSFDGIKLDSNIQYDINSKVALAKVNIDRNTDSYLKGKAYVNLNEKKLYVTEENLTDKIINFNISESIEGQIQEVIEESGIQSINKDTAKAVSKKVYKVINNNLPKEYFSSQSFTANINGTVKEVTDNILTMTYEQFNELCINVITTLKTDLEFIENFSNKEDVLDLFNEALNSLSKAEKKNGEIKVHYYTTGIFNSFVGITVETTDEKENKQILEIESQSKNSYITEFKVIENKKEEKFFTLTANVNKLKENEQDLSLYLNIEGEGNIGIKFVNAIINNREIVPFDVTTSVNVGELSQDDKSTIKDNFINAPMYDLIKEYSKQFELNFGDNNIDENTPNNVTLKEGQSFIQTYDDSIVKFSVPSTFEEEYSGNSHKSYSKNSATVNVDAEYYTVDEYTKKIDESLDNYKNKDEYKDFKISQVEEIEVNGIKFNKKSLEYTSVSGEYSYIYSRVYYYTKINDSYVYVVEIKDDSEIMTDNELNKFLTIEL